MTEPDPRTEPEAFLPSAVEQERRLRLVAAAEDKYEPLVARLTLEELLGLNNVVSTEVGKRSTRVRRALRKAGLLRDAGTGIGR
jgi:hypothetical protein